jgi:hypothetical protein
MTHDDFPNWVRYLLVAVTAALLLAIGRLGARGLSTLVRRITPARFIFVRRAVFAVLMMIFYSIMAAVLILLDSLVLSFLS